MEFSFKPHAPQAFHWDRSQQHSVGHVTSLTIATQDFNADLSLMDPTSTNNNSVSVVGAIDSITWNGRPGGALQLSFVCTTANRRLVLGMLHNSSTQEANITSIKKATISVAFAIYDYDPIGMAYFASFHTGDSTITGKLEMDDGKQEVERKREELAQAQADLAAGTAGPKDEAAEEKRYLTRQDRRTLNKMKGEGALRDEDEYAKWSREQQRESSRPTQSSVKNLQMAVNKAREAYIKAEREYQENRKRGAVELKIALDVDSEPEDDPLSPQVWMVTLTMLPPEVTTADENGVIHYAVANYEPLVKQWGVLAPKTSGA